MPRCVQCGRDTVRGPACAECVRDVLEEADRERIPVIGNRPEARRIGFVAPEPKKGA